MLDTLLLILHINKLHKCICYSAVQGCHKYATKKYGWMILILIQYFPILNLSIYLVSVKKIFKSRIFIKSILFSKVNFFQKSVFFKRQYLFMSHNFFKSQFFKVIFIQNKFIEKIHLKKNQYLKTF